MIRDPLGKAILTVPLRVLGGGWSQEWLGAGGGPAGVWIGRGWGGVATDISEGNL